MSYEFDGAVVRRRIDRVYQYADYWIWAFPDLSPAINYTMVSQTGADGYACFNRGQNSFFQPDPMIPLGFADGILAEFLQHQSLQFAFPAILSFLRLYARNNTFSEIQDVVTGIKSPGIFNSVLDLTIIFDKDTFLPYMIRSHENNKIFGSSTSDLVLSDYQPIQVSNTTSVMIPRRFQTVYNSRDTLEDFLVESVELNPAFGEDFFEPDGRFTKPEHGPEKSAEYDHAEVHGFFETGLWSGVFDSEKSYVNVTSPINGFDKVLSAYVDYPDYVQMLVVYEAGVLITDAPAHRSKIIIEWIRQNLGKEVRWVVPSHHHHDHAYGVGDFLAVGATLVVPEIALDYYSRVNGGNFSSITYNETTPFFLHDEEVQFRAFYHDDAPHARDWTYAMAARSCPVDQEVILFNADVWSPGSDALRFDTGYARQWLDTTVADGMPRDSIVIGAHGDTKSGTTDRLSSLASIVGYQYPNLTAANLRSESAKCVDM